MAPPGVGFTFTPDRPIGDLPRVAREAEELGFDQLWLWEDCFLSGGIATSATALAAGTTITVGLGIMPAVFRNVAATAMEVATLANLYPGRFRYVEELQRLGADIRTDGHHAVVRGVERLSGAPVRAPDIRAGAALVVAGLAAEGETVVSGVHHVDRGYDDLVGRLVTIGADIERV